MASRSCFTVAAVPARRAPDLELQVDAQAATGQVADATLLAIVPVALHRPTRPIGRFLDCRARGRTRACGSPKIPRTIELGTESWQAIRIPRRRGRRGVGMRVSRPISASPREPFRPRPERVSASSAPLFHPLEDPELERLFQSASTASAGGGR
jgi:hypothetical protein